MKTLIRPYGPLLAAILFGCAAAHAAQPQTLNYQGNLTTAAGMAVPNGSQAMTFRLYNMASGGSPLYSETQTVAVTNGLFNVQIGSVSPINLPFDVPYFLGVSVGADAEMTPRQPLASSAYAFRAASADAVAAAATVVGSQITGSITTATIPAANVVGGVGGAGTVTSVGTGPGLTGGPITGAGTIGLAPTNLLPTTACAEGQIPKWASGAWTCDVAAILPTGGAIGQILASNGVLGAQWTASPTFSGNLNLANSTATAGNILKNGNQFLHNYGTDNTFLGMGSGNFIATGSSNTGLGVFALAALSSGFDNTAVGSFALDSNSTGFNNTATGSRALAANTVGADNTAIGSYALASNTVGHTNTATGRYALTSNLNGTYNTAIGSNALFDNTSGTRNAALGSFALELNTSGEENTAVGFFALGENTIGNENTASGARALRKNTTGSSNTATGVEAMYANTIGIRNAALGTLAMRSNTTGNYNTANGASALFSNTDGSNNTATGVDALYSNTLGNLNSAHGTQALYSNTTGTYNTASGLFALNRNTNGNQNTAYGGRALYSNTTGNNNISIGYNAGNLHTTGNHNIAIANDGVAAESNTIRIGSIANQTRTFIAGINGSSHGPEAARVVSVDGNGMLGTEAVKVGMGTNIPQNRLHVYETINGTGHPENHVMQIENGSTGSGPDVLALRVNTAGNVGTGVNFITFFNDDYYTTNQSIGSIQGNGTGGVMLAGPGNDFAEYVPKLDPAETMEPGDLVGVRGGKATRDLANVEQIMVVSTGAIVAGNDPGEARRDQYALLAFIGQANVKVVGPVNAGDYLIAQGNRAIAISPAAMNASWIASLVGRAWASSSEEGEKPVRAVVGVERGEKQLVAALAEMREENRRSMQALREENQVLKGELALIKKALGLR
jgi:hypothetical protein